MERRTKKMRILTISHLFPRKETRYAGIFMCRESEYFTECDFLVTPGVGDIRVALVDSEVGMASTPYGSIQNTLKRSPRYDRY